MTKVNWTVTPPLESCVANIALGKKGGGAGASVISCDLSINQELNITTWDDE